MAIAARGKHRHRVTPRRGRAAPTPAATRTPLSGSVEDYLKTIYEIELGGAAAATNEIAQRLAIAPASVSGMVRRMADNGLLAHERYHGVRLTPAGRRAALRTLRRHRILESYLARALGYPWDSVHAEAERLEHAVSEDLIDRMAAAIGEPDVDPHGAPIPTREGAVDERRLITLADLVAAQRARVVRVRDEDPALLRYLQGLGIVPGAAIEVVARAPFGGPITVRVRGGKRTVGPALGAEVLVDAAGFTPRSPRVTGASEKGSRH
jgi:DtxR family Mn-dependent transcriptional regulator